MQVVGEVLTVKRAGAYHHLTMVAPGVPERFRPGTFVTVAVGGALSSGRAAPCAAGAPGPTDRCLRRHRRVRLRGGRRGHARGWPVPRRGTPLDVVGPLGRPFALPKEPVTCVLVGEGCASAPLFSLAERLRERECAVHMLLGAPTEAALFGALEARRATRGVTVATADGSVGLRGGVVDALPDLLVRTQADVVYAAGPHDVLHGVARAAETHGAWSQTAVDVPDGVRHRALLGLRAAGRRRGRRHPDGPWPAPRARSSAATGSGGRTSGRSRRTPGARHDRGHLGRPRGPAAALAADDRGRLRRS